MRKMVDCSRPKSKHSTYFGVLMDPQTKVVQESVYTIKFEGNHF